MSIKGYLKELWQESRNFRFIEGPWWAVIGYLIYGFALGANVFSAGVAVASGRNPTFSLIVAGIILLIGAFGVFLDWHTAYLKGQTKVYKENVEHDQRLLNILRGTYGQKETDGITG